MDQVRREAARRGETVTGLIESGLRLILSQAHTPARRKQVKLPVVRARGGVLPGVALNDNAALLDIIEGRR